MATITWVVLKHHKKADGTFNPKIRITHNRTTVYIPTEIYTQLVRFKRGSSTGIITDGNITDCLNNTVREIRQVLNENPGVVDQADTAKELNIFIEEYKTRQNLNVDFIEFARDYLANLPEKSRKRATYATSINLLCHYLSTTKGAIKLPIKLFTAKLLLKFETWLRTERVITTNVGMRVLRPTADNGIANYMNGLKYMYNRIKDAYNNYETGDILIKAEPFKVYKTPKVKQVRKRAISKDELLKICNYIPEKNRRPDAKILELMARDLFIFSFMAAGMNAVDIFQCQNLQNGKIEYCRSKTTDRKLSGDAFISITVTERMQSIIERYKDPKGEMLFLFCRKYSTHLQLNIALHRGLKSIGEKVGIPNLQFYSARHSFATIARNDCGVGMDDIALCLTHASFYRVTDMYIKPDFSRVDEVIRKVVDFVFDEKPVIVKT